MSYEKFYGLREEPFSLAADGRFFYESNQHLEAMERILHGIDSMKGLVVMLGEMGTGKTLLCRKILDRLQNDEYEASLLIIVHSEITATWFLKKIAHQVGVAEPAETRINIVSQIQSKLMELYEQGKKVVIIVDEANMLRDAEIFQEIRNLFNLETAGRKLLSIVLIGLPELEKNINLDPQLVQRIAVKFSLRSLGQEASRQYIKHRLLVAGVEKEVFTADAADMVYQYSKGIPRLINTICDNCLLESFLVKSQLVLPDVVEQTASDLGLKRSELLKSVPLSFVSSDKKADAINKPDPDALMQYRITLQSAIQSGDADKAINAYKEVIRLDQENFEIRQRLAELYEQKNMGTEAIKEYLIIANAYFNDRLHKKAMAIYQKILQLDPNYVDARSLLADIYAKEGMEEEAKKEFLSAAVNYLEHGNLEKALQTAQKAVQLRSITAYYVLGVVCFKKGMLNEAKRHLESMLRYIVYHKGALMCLAKIHETQLRNDEAIAIYEKIVKSEPDSPLVFLEIARLCAQSGNKQKGAANYLAAANAYRMRGAMDKALDASRQAEGLAPEDFEIHKLMVDIFLQKNMPRDAASEFLWLRNYYRLRGESQKAREAHEAALKYDPLNPNLKGPDFTPEAPSARPIESSGSINPKTQIYLRVAESVLKKGLKEEAVELYRKALDEEPGNAEAISKLQMLLAQRFSVDVTPEVSIMNTELRKN